MNLNKPKQIEIEKLKGVDIINSVAEPKLDGMRATITVENNKVKILSESGNNKTFTFPELISKQLSILPDCIIDGEICILESELKADFNKLQPRMNLQNPVLIDKRSQQTPAKFMAFDILNYKDKSLLNMNYDERKVILESTVRNIPNILYVKAYDVQDLWKQIVELDGEGIVIKKKRGYNSEWLKVKNFKEDDFKIIGYTSETRLISALELSDLDGNYVGKVNYTGQQDLEYVKSKIGKIAKIRYLGKSGKLRIPILKEIM